jgi:glyceraldehyde 3-phosphate dehydrogenase
MIDNDWDRNERAVEAMIPLIGQMYREKTVEISVFGQLMVKRTVNDILKAHEAVHQIEDVDLLPEDTLAIVEALSRMPLSQAHIDIGKMVVKYYKQGSGNTRQFLERELATAMTGDNEERRKKDVVLYGFGRIGRLLARLLCDRTGGGRGMRLAAIVVRRGQGNDLQKRASLLRLDSVHGAFDGVVNVDEETNELIVNGQRVKVIYADSPETLDYPGLGISNALVIDNTGVWRDEEGLGLHLQAGAAQVLLTAPGKGDIKNIVHGINHDTISRDDRILSAASCTTNAIGPVLKAINEKFGIASGHMETVHAYTNDQNLIDNYHKGDRRGRSAALNMVLTETGAAKAVAKALPEMEGKLTGNSVRVPTPNVSMAILNLNLENAATIDEINDHMRYTALHSDLQKQVGYSNAPDAVSTDFVGSRSAGVFDALATIVNGNRCVLYVWYDNEFGYACQVMRILRQLTHSTLTAYPLSE